MKRQQKTASSTPYFIRPHSYRGPDLIVEPGKIGLLKAV
jgi:hypothetical protein